VNGRASTRQELTSDDGERVAVARIGRALSACLLGSDVTRRAEDRPGQGQPLGCTVVARDPKVGDLHAVAVVEQKVLGLEVAVDDSQLVSRVDGVGYLVQPSQRPSVSHGTFRKHVSDAAAGLKLHHEERLTTPAAAVVDRDDVRMATKSCGDHRLARKAGRNRRIGGSLRRQELDGDLPIELEIVRKQHFGRSTAAEHPNRAEARWQKTPTHHKKA
jgi:hypothetical protein